MIYIGEQKTLCDLRLGDHEEKKTQEERITLKVWKMTTPESRIDIRSVEEVKFGLVKDGGTKEVKRGEGKMPQYHKKAHGKFLGLTQAEGKKNDASYMKIVDEFITDCGGLS